MIGIRKNTPLSKKDLIELLNKILEKDEFMCEILKNKLNEVD